MTEYAFRTFSLPCSGGLCKSETLPSCTEPLEWDESVIVSHQCQETPFNNDTLLCSQNGTKEVNLRSKVGGGVVQELAILPCLDCTHLLAWTPWELCTKDHPADEKVTTRCRWRGSQAVGFETEKGGMESIQIV